MMFRHFDKDKSGKLSHDEFKSCLRALGYDLPIPEEEVDGEPEFEAILTIGEFCPREGSCETPVSVPPT